MDKSMTIPPSWSHSLIERKYNWRRKKETKKRNHQDCNLASTNKRSLVHSNNTQASTSKLKEMNLKLVEITPYFMSCPSVEEPS